MGIWSQRSRGSLVHPNSLSRCCFFLGLQLSVHGCGCKFTWLSGILRTSGGVGCGQREGQQKGNPEAHMTTQNQLCVGPVRAVKDEAQKENLLFWRFLGDSRCTGHFTDSFRLNEVAKFKSLVLSLDYTLLFFKRRTQKESHT